MVSLEETLLDALLSCHEKKKHQHKMGLVCLLQLYCPVLQVVNMMSMLLAVGLRATSFPCAVILISVMCEAVRTSGLSLILIRNVGSA